MVTSLTPCYTSIKHSKPIPYSLAVFSFYFCFELPARFFKIPPGYYKSDFSTYDLKTSFLSAVPFHLFKMYSLTSDYCIIMDSLYNIALFIHNLDTSHSYIVDYYHITSLDFHPNWFSGNSPNVCYCWQPSQFHSQLHTMTYDK